MFVVLAQDEACCRRPFAIAAATVPLTVARVLPGVLVGALTLGKAAPYLVNGLGHCGACHTPKSLLGGDKASEYLLLSEFFDKAVHLLLEGFVVVFDWHRSILRANLRTTTP